VLGRRAGYAEGTGSSRRDDGRYRRTHARGSGPRATCVTRRLCPDRSRSSRPLVPRSPPSPHTRSCSRRHACEPAAPPGRGVLVVPAHHRAIHSSMEGAHEAQGWFISARVHVLGESDEVHLGSCEPDAKKSRGAGWADWRGTESGCRRLLGQCSVAAAKSAMEGNSQSGVTGADGAGVAPQPGRSWRRLIQTVGSPACFAGT
jgi:hypothetical protein